MSATDSVLASTLLAGLLLGLGKPYAIAQQIKPDALIAQASPFQSQVQPINSPYSSSVESAPNPASQTAAGYTLIHVDSTVGNNTTGDGSQFRPFQTITQALRSAPPNSIVLLAPGVYSSATGESFPLLLKSGVTVQGNPNASDRPVLIQGGGFLQSASARQRRNATILAADRSGLANVTVTNPTPDGHGLWIETGSPIILESRFVGSRSSGIFIAGSGAPIIRGNYFNQNRLAGLIVNGHSQAEVRENLFEATGVGIRVAEGARPRISHNRIIHNQDGLVILENAQPELEANQISQNRRNGLVEFGPSAISSTHNGTGEHPNQELNSVTVSLAEQADSSRLVQPAQPVQAPMSAGDSPTLNQTTQIAAGVATESRSATPQTAQTIVSVEDASPTPNQPPSIEAAAATESRPTQATQPAQAPVSAVDAPSMLNQTTLSVQSVTMNQSVTDLNVSQPADQPIAAFNAPQTEVNESAAAPTVEQPEIPPDISIPTAASSMLDQTGTDLPEISTLSDQASSDLPTVTLPAQILPSTSSPGETVTEDSSPPINQATPVDAEGADKETDSPRFSALLTRLGVPNLSPNRLDQPTPESAQTEAIEIPVIFPSTNQADPINQLAIGSATPTSESTVGATEIIEIPVIAPPVSDPELSHLPEIPSDPTPAPDIAAPLQVPSSDIPIGSISGLPTISTPVEATDRTDAPPVPPSRATSLGLYYRVLVQAEDEATQAQVRAQVPDAFRIHFDGQIVMQVGAYADQAAADELADRLIQNGLEASVEFIQ